MIRHSRGTFERMNGANTCANSSSAKAEQATSTWNRNFASLTDSNSATR